MSCDLTLMQATRSLTGFERIEIRKVTGQHIASMLEDDPLTAAEAVAYVVERRSTPGFTWADAQAWSIGDVDSYFKPEDDADPLDSKTTMTS